MKKKIDNELEFFWRGSYREDLIFKAVNLKKEFLLLAVDLGHV